MPIHFQQLVFNPVNELAGARQFRQGVKEFNDQLARVVAEDVAPHPVRDHPEAPIASVEACILVVIPNVALIGKRAGGGDERV